MKKILFILPVFFSLACFSQDTETKPSIIKVNPLGVIFGNASIGYEKSINAKSSFVVTPTFGFFNAGSFKYSTFGIGGEYRIYIKEHAPTGLYVSPGIGLTFGKAKYDGINVNWNTFDVTNTTNETNITGLQIRGVLGYQWVYKSGFVLDLNGGIQYMKLSFKDKSGVFASNTAFGGILPALGLSIGYNF